MIVIMRNREGKAGGGKGPMLGEDKSFTLATFNDQTLFIVPIHNQATRFSGKRGEKQDGKGNGLGIGENGAPMNTLTKADRHAVGIETIVRRLTPVECERLQGFPDDWTAEQADSNRYKQMGNAVTVNVARWIGSRL